MHRRVRTALSLSMSALVFSGYMALGTTLEYGRTVLLIPVFIFMLMPMAEWLDARYPIYRKVTTLLTLCYTLSIPIVLMRYALFPTVVALVIYIQSYKLLHVKEDRDYHHIFLMSFFLLVTACVLSPDASIALPILLYLASSVWAFFTLQVHMEASKVAQGFEADIVPLNVRHAVATQARSKRFVDFGVVVSSSAITLSCILMTLVFFVATPRLEAGMLGGSSLSTAPQRSATGVSESVDLSIGGTIQQDTTPVMRVFTPDEQDGHYTGPMYWRCTSLDRYNGIGWEKQNDATWIEDRTQSVRYVPSGPTSLDRSPLHESAKVVKQTIYLDRVPDTGIPALSLVLRAESKGNARLRWNRQKGDGTFELADRNRTSVLYEALSEVDEPDPTLLRMTRANYDKVMYLDHLDRLTHHDLAPDLVQQVRGLTDPFDNVYDKVSAIERYLSEQGGFVYSLSTPEGTIEHPIDQFLRQTKSGHCELFATAMALMVRSLGIPARVATGYRGGEWDNSDKSITVRQDMAHLWVEVYFIDYGWVIFDPSPPDDSVPQPARNWFQHTLYSNLLKGKMFWYQDVVGYSAGRGFAGFHGVTLKLLGWLKGDESRLLGTYSTERYLAFRDWVFIAFSWVIGLPLAIFVGVKWRRSGGAPLAKRILLTRDQARATRLFRIVRRKLQIGVDDVQGKTADELLRDVQAAGSPIQSVVQRLVEAYNQVRFGGRPFSRAQFAELRREVRSL